MISPSGEECEFVRDLPGGAQAQISLVRVLSTNELRVLKRYDPAADPSSAAGSGRFDREVEVLANHRNEYLPLYYGADRESLTIEMERIEGFNLTQVVETQGPLLGVRLQNFAVSLLDFYTKIHAVGVCLRDNKANQVFVAEDGTVLRVIDYGGATIEGGGDLTQVGDIFGNLNGLPPEVHEGVEPDPYLIDAWQAGLLIATARWGRSPFGEGLREIARRKMEHREGIDISGPGVPEIVAAAVQDLTAPPERRLRPRVVLQRIRQLQTGSSTAFIQLPARVEAPPSAPPTVASPLHPDPPPASACGIVGPVAREPAAEASGEPWWRRVLEETAAGIDQLIEECRSLIPGWWRREGDPAPAQEGASRAGDVRAEPAGRESGSDTKFIALLPYEMPRQAPPIGREQEPPKERTVRAAVVDGLAAFQAMIRRGAHSAVLSTLGRYAALGLVGSLVGVTAGIGLDVILPVHGSAGQDQPGGSRAAAIPTASSGDLAPTRDTDDTGDTGDTGNIDEPVEGEQSLPEERSSDRVLPVPPRVKPPPTHVSASTPAPIATGGGRCGEQHVPASRPADSHVRLETRCRLLLGGGPWLSSYCDSLRLREPNKTQCLNGATPDIFRAMYLRKCKEQTP